MRWPTPSGSAPAAYCCSRAARACGSHAGGPPSVIALVRCGEQRAAMVVSAAASEVQSGSARQTRADLSEELDAMVSSSRATTESTEPLWPVKALSQLQRGRGSVRSTQDTPPSRSSSRRMPTRALSGHAHICSYRAMRACRRQASIRAQFRRPRPKSGGRGQIWRERSRWSAAGRTGLVCASATLARLLC